MMRRNLASQLEHWDTIDLVVPPSLLVCNHPVTRRVVHRPYLEEDTECVDCGVLVGKTVYPPDWGGC